MTHEGRKKYLLIADDDPAIREVLPLLLTGEGYAVVCAEDGQTAAELAAPEIDLYIPDVNMPRTSGFSAGAEIRKRFDTPTISTKAYGTTTPWGTPPSWCISRTSARSWGTISAIPPISRPPGEGGITLTEPTRKRRRLSAEILATFAACLAAAAMVTALLNAIL